MSDAAGAKTGPLCAGADAAVAARAAARAQALLGRVLDQAQKRRRRGEEGGAEEEGLTTAESTRGGGRQVTLTHCAPEQFEQHAVRQRRMSAAAAAGARGSVQPQASVQLTLPQMSVQQTRPLSPWGDATSEEEVEAPVRKAKPKRRKRLEHEIPCAVLSDTESEPELVLEYVYSSNE
jgi:hypothetical protein